VSWLGFYHQAGRMASALQMYEQVHTGTSALYRDVATGGSECCRREARSPRRRAKGSLQPRGS
jgi:hypothetical protein